MFRTILICAMFSGTFASAKNLRIITDIAPIHSLVSAVVGDTQDVMLIIAQNVDLHHFALRPQQAVDLQSSEVIVHVGRSLIPWFNETAETLAPDAVIIELQDTVGLSTFGLREHGEDGHDHDDTHGMDPHIWLDPDNAVLMLENIASSLAALDKDNAQTYMVNTAALIVKINEWRDETDLLFAGLGNVPFLVGHDAFQYFEHAHNLVPAGFVTDALGTAPNINAMRSLSAETVKCIFVDVNEKGPHTVQIAKQIGASEVFVDALGSDLALGADLYLDMMQDLAAAFQGCLSNQ